MQRRTLITGALGLTAGLAGCAATQEEFEFEAEPAAFDDAAVNEAGYERVQQQDIVVDRSVEAGGTERDVTVTNYATAYSREVSVGDQTRPLASAVVFSTPSISIVGQEFNPAASENLLDLVARASDQLDDRFEAGSIRDITKVEERDTTVLETETTMGVFDAVAETDGRELTLRLLVARVQRDGDIIVVGAAYPQQLVEEERSRAETLFGNVEHGA
ncbi:DUF6517 family protein [Natronomonas sp.]|uniref:DUF6517 family protein n=1 Tax=Natronomonas sp. TaxID=2184060 RepID=UPI002639EA26|nr:DUF6517 family protein [Natronomonas sp.]